MKDYSKADLTAASVVLWILENKIVTETGKPFEFTRHRFMIDYLADEHPWKVTIKASQVGWTTCELLDDIHLVGLRGLTTIHTMHNSDFLQSFVRPRVNPLIANNPVIAKMAKSDSEGLKGFNGNFLYFKGANAQSQAISTPADVVKFDELDKSDATTVELFRSRMNFSEYKRIREFSNPTSIGFGVDASWQQSDQRHWFVRCSHCGHDSYIDFDPDESVDPRPHYVDRVKRIFACGNCGDEIYDRDRINGRWVAKYPNRTKIHGYWVSQMMVTWFTAGQIVDEFENSSVEYFHSMILGKAYTQADLRFDRDTIVKATRPGVPVLQNVVMGSDIGEPHWYWLGTPNGVFKMGRAKDWEELERIFLEYNCKAWVTDYLPDYTQAKYYIKKYPGRVFACTFRQDRNMLGTIQWGEGDKRGIVYADRTKAIDQMVSEFSSGANHFLMRPDELEELIKHAANMYRVIETDEVGKTKVEWRTVKKPDHLLLTGVYWRIALEKVFGGLGAGVVTTEPSLPTVQRAPTLVDGKGTLAVDVKGSLAKAQTIR